MISVYWLVVIALCGGVFALFGMWAYAQMIKSKTRLSIVENTAAQQQELLMAARRELADLEKREITTRVQKEELDKRLVAQADEMQKAQHSLKLEFQAAANAMFENISQKFSAQSEKKIGDLLTPLQQRLSEFQKKVDDAFGAQGKEQHTLKSEIEKIVNMNAQMRLQTESLTKALRGDVKAQGNWGEVILERILEESGLQKGVNYIMQGSELGLKGAEGNILKPDVVVLLPDDKHLVIDAKVSLTAYERYCAEPEAGEAHLQAFIKSIRAHVNGLEQKRYQDIEKLGSPDFVFMFMPIEGAFMLALQRDPELHHYAWGKKIVLVSSTTLLACLSTIASLWRIERQNRNAQEIARQGGALYDKFLGFLNDMETIGNRLKQTQNSYDSALSKLSTGTGNLMRGVEKLKTLGAKTTKSLPKDLLLEDNVMHEDTEETTQVG